MTKKFKLKISSKYLNIKPGKNPSKNDNESLVNLKIKKTN